MNAPFTIALDLIVLLVICTSITSGAEPTSQQSSPDENLPPHITRITGFGERADWSHDGKKILFLSKTFGVANLKLW